MMNFIEVARKGLSKRAEYLFLFLFLSLSFFSSLLFSSLLVSAPPQPKNLSPQDIGSHVDINNSIVARVNGKPITLLDVVKKMDLVFDKQFPQYSQVPAARYQFYSVNWKYVLKDMIDKELILADAAALKVNITPAELRKEVDQLFGPNVVAGLDKAQLSHDEANEMVKADMTIRKMIQGKVHTKALREVTPQAVRRAYEKHIQEVRYPEKWTYQVISFRDQDSNQSAEVANLSHYLLNEGKVSPEELKQVLVARNSLGTTAVNISEEFHHEPKEVAEAYREVLATLPDGGYSQPVAQKSRAVGQLLFRIFYLKEKQEEHVDAFEAVENELKQKIAEEAVARYTEEYIEKLRKLHDVQDSTESMVSNGWQPFILR